MLNINLKLVNELAKGNHLLVLNIVKGAISQIDQHLPSIEQSFQNKDLKGISNASYKLKSSIQVIGGCFLFDKLSLISNFPQDLDCDQLELIKEVCSNTKDDLAKYYFTTSWDILKHDFEKKH